MKVLSGGQRIRGTDKASSLIAGVELIVLSRTYRDIINAHFNNPANTMQAVDVDAGQAWGFKSDDEYELIAEAKVKEGASV